MLSPVELQAGATPLITHLAGKNLRASLNEACGFQDFPIALGVSRIGGGRLLYIYIY